MASNIKLSTVQGEKRDTTTNNTIDIEESVDRKKKKDDLHGFVKISVRGTLFEMARTTIYRSAFLWRLVQDSRNSNDGFYHIDRDPNKFNCLMNYLVENQVSRILPCSVQELYNEALFYGIDLPENDCWGTTLSYTLKNINKYNIRGQLKSFADRHGIFGWVEWKQRLLVNIEFHCHRTIDSNLVYKYMVDQESEHIFIIQSVNEKDKRKASSATFQCPKTGKHRKEEKNLKKKLFLQATTRTKI
jgi:hypothetical protein